MKQIKLVLMMYVGLSSFLGFGQELDLSVWKRDSVPLGDLLPFHKGQSDRLLEANQSKDHWYFEITPDTVLVKNHPCFKIKGDSLPFVINDIGGLGGYKYVKKVSNGYLIGSNGGEFGGGLKFVALNKGYSYNIKTLGSENGDRPVGAVNQIESGALYGYRSRNIYSIFEFNGKLYATEGMSHLAYDKGAIIEIFNDNDKWCYRHVSEFIEAPRVTFKYKDSLYVITGQYILKLDKAINTTQVLRAPFYWGLLYPSSAFVNNTDMYIAMRKGIMVIRDFETHPNYEWYVEPML
ncbi:hypothetical protein [Mangrovimonas sp. YM274]|uniref:hypothetical protein n=1 Tax=Mangrovimonas sp. YM274 TaxID=3070660 RepID=UPI0027DB2118|nr:hypothetical protein [Mangrovimonas sp. YM274]WMI69170.1 hypothetical protein RBH95_02075 [Mangrovimonas sp. YM274]